MTELNNNSNSESQRSLRRSGFLSELTVHEISREFVDFGRQKRVLVIPIGFPQAGKSLLISSLMYFAVRGAGTLFRTNLKNDFPFDRGRQTAQDMIDFFNEGRLFKSTEEGSLDLIGIDITPTKAKLPPLNLAFLDLAGEDIKKIRTNEGASFSDRINAVFNGIRIDNSPLIFVLITPFDPPRKDNETSQNAHDREDGLHYEFLNYLRENQPQLLGNAKFFVVVSQWDKNPNQVSSVEDFIREKRPSIYNYVRNSRVVWGQYSIGQILESRGDQNTIIQEIVRINRNYPDRFWKKLYQICTNQSLDHKNWWQKLFG